jgi:phosphatidylglycerophosphate synthase
MEAPYLSKINEEDIMFLKSMLEPYLPIVSQYVTSKQLTLCTILWSVLLVLSGYLARKHCVWFLLSIFALVMHMITDILDGSLSVYNNDGLHKWNFFMDHLLDFTLAVSIFAGLAIFVYRRSKLLLTFMFISFALVAINMVASFLMIHEEQALDIGIRISDSLSINIFYMHFVLIAIYTYIIFVGKKSIKDMQVITPYLTYILAVLTVYNIYTKQSKLLPEK